MVNSSVENNRKKSYGATMAIKNSNDSTKRVSITFKYFQC